MNSLFRFYRHDSNEMKLKLADTYLKLGEIGLETGNHLEPIFFVNASNIEDELLSSARSVDAILATQCY